MRGIMCSKCRGYNGDGSRDGERRVEYSNAAVDNFNEIHARARELGKIRSAEVTRGVEFAAGGAGRGGVATRLHIGRALKERDGKEKDDEKAKREETDQEFEAGKETSGDNAAQQAERSRGDK